MNDGDREPPKSADTNEVPPGLEETLPPSWIRDRQQSDADSDSEKLAVPGSEEDLVASSTAGAMTPDAELAEFPASLPQTTDELPQRFGDYELLEEVARGGMGVVFRARDLNLDRQVALKMILNDKLAEDSDVQRFYAEAQSAAALVHPGVVPVHEVGERNGQHFFCMGFIEGESLGALIARSPLSPKNAAQMVQKISETMVYAHGEGVIHRDLKPANVLLDKKNNPHISDFGLAKKVSSDSDLTIPGQIIGTPSYMPPEQASGETDRIGPIADVYSLGAILYCCLTGRAPFQAANPMETLRQVIERDPVPPRYLNVQIDRDLDTICLKCLEKDPQHRYGSAQEVVDELDRFLNGQPIKARRISVIDRSLRWCRRNPVTTILLTALFLTLIGGLSGINWWQKKAERRGLQAEQAEESEMDMAVDVASEISEAVEAQEFAEAQLTSERQDFRVAHAAIVTWTQNILSARAAPANGFDPQQKIRLEASLRYFQQFVQRHVDLEKKLATLAEAHFFSGQILAVTDRPQEALRSYQQVLHVLEKPVESIPEADRHARLGAASFQSARLNGWLDAKIQGSSEYDVVEKERRHQQYQQQIRLMLRQAYAHGYFKDPEHLDRLKKDEHLLAFRSRAEYSKLLGEINASNQR